MPSPLHPSEGFMIHATSAPPSRAADALMRTRTCALAQVAAHAHARAHDESGIRAGAGPGVGASTGAVAEAGACRWARRKGTGVAAFRSSHAPQPRGRRNGARESESKTPKR
eukprot:3797185-Pleurochrysis_carterae.AAC.1